MADAKGVIGSSGVTPSNDESALQELQISVDTTQAMSTMQGVACPSRDTTDVQGGNFNDASVVTQQIDSLMTKDGNNNAFSAMKSPSTAAINILKPKAKKTASKSLQKLSKSSKPAKPSLPPMHHIPPQPNQASLHPAPDAMFVDGLVYHADPLIDGSASKGSANPMQQQLLVDRGLSKVGGAKKITSCFLFAGTSGGGAAQQEITVTPSTTTIAMVEGHDDVVVIDD